MGENGNRQEHGLHDYGHYGEELFEYKEEIVEHVGFGCISIGSNDKSVSVAKKEFNPSPIVRK